jgi:multidrug efflux pump
MAPKFNALAGRERFPITPPFAGARASASGRELRDPDFGQLREPEPRDAQMLDEIAKNPGIQSVDVDLRLNKPELRIDIDREKAADLGVAVEWWRARSRPCWAAARSRATSATPSSTT